MKVIKKGSPDTRNKLDAQKDLNKKPQFKKKFPEKKGSPEKKRTFEVKKKKDEKEEKPKISKGKLFKMQYGYSKTMKRNMKKHGLNPLAYSDSLADYRGIRKKRKAVERKQRQEKHSKSVAYKRANGKKKGAKGKAPAPKKVEVKKAA